MQHIGTFLHNEMGVSWGGISPMCDCSSIHRQKIFFLRSIEWTYHWYWLVDGLMDAGYRGQLANPAAMQQYSGLKYTDDHADARWLAHVVRLGVLPEGYISPKAQRAVRAVLRKRAPLVR
jgi:hypothetical protein